MLLLQFSQKSWEIKFPNVLILENIMFMSYIYIADKNTSTLFKLNVNVKYVCMRTQKIGAGLKGVLKSIL